MDGSTGEGVLGLGKSSRSIYDGAQGHMDSAPSRTPVGNEHREWSSGMEVGNGQSAVFPMCKNPMALPHNAHLPCQPHPNTP